MHVDSRYPIRHNVSSCRERRACHEFLKQGHRLSPFPQEGSDKRLIIRSTTHAPDQARITASTLPLGVDFAAPSHSYCAFDSE
jgi:hypothetical protein